LLCSPHNPVGRVWQSDELTEILRIARQYGLVVLSDEIHADLVYPDQQQTMMATLADEADKLITAVAPSKTFNIPGLGLSCLIIPNPEVRAKISTVFASQHVNASNPFSIVAFEAAYREGGAWLEALMVYLQGTRDLVLDYVREHLSGIRAIAPEGTYLMWLDCRDMQLSNVALRDFFIHQAKLGMNPGTVFGTGGSGFMRLNLAAPRHIIMAALQRVSQAQGLSG
jgi:cystathionine beta-lyase